MTSMSEKLDAGYAPAWRPDPGAKLVGEVVGIAERAGEYDTYPIVTIRQDGGEELAVHAFHHVLAGELAKARPKIGETVGVKYLGRRARRDGSGSEYNAYKVEVDRPDETFSWAKFASDEPDGTPDTPADPPATETPDDAPIPF